MLKRYIVFAGPVLYAAGGSYDLRDSYDTEEEAVARIKRIENDEESWGHVYDSENDRVIFEIRQAYQ